MKLFVGAFAVFVAAFSFFTVFMSFRVPFLVNGTTTAFNCITLVMLTSMLYSIHILADLERRGF
jgi:hypothetical protein